VCVGCVWVCVWVCVGCVGVCGVSEGVWGCVGVCVGVCVREGCWARRPVSAWALGACAFLRVGTLSTHHVTVQACPVSPTGPSP
jgi:hypothetical protein